MHNFRINPFSKSGRFRKPIFILRTILRKNEVLHLVLRISPGLKLAVNR